MGKRKLVATSFWQCDWTGFPMKAAHCYFPTWSATGKLCKKGSFCNWESVVAAAHEQLERDAIDAEEHAKIMLHIESVTGTTVHRAPHYNELAHTKGHLTAEQFHASCAAHKGPITGVKIASNGDVFEVIIHPDRSGQFVFADYLHKPFTYHGVPHNFHSMRKKGSKSTDRDLSVWYYGVKDLPHNHTASNLFKMQLYGDILLVQQSRENCFMARERFVSYSKALYDDTFVKKRKRPEVQCMSVESYAEAKEQMQDALNQYEQKVSQTAVPPKKMSKVESSGRIDGRTLAQKVKAR